MKKIFVLLLAASVVCVGCGKKVSEKLAEKLMEKSMEKDGVKGDVDISNGKVTINATDKDGKKITINQSGENVTVKGQDGTATFSSGTSAKVPDNFPKDVYVHAGATVVTAMTVPEGFSVALQTKDGAEKIAAAYKSKMTSNGWAEESSLNMPQQTIIAYKKDNRRATVMIIAADSDTQINLTVMTEK